MSIEPYQGQNYDLIPMTEGASYKEIRALERTARQAIFMIRLEAAVKALRLDVSYRLHMEVAEKHIEFGEYITGKIIKNDNPMVRGKLVDLFDNWELNAKRIINGGF
ncbi:hypothetical protein ACKI1I_46115 [Streptomyces turgidiscabies]|uniref:Uncharacterized protein n=1 Tax=Streptomyces turgidiscabies (strain Car8) TaxID=698760 RepID=L7F5J5_STRT8|nr:MULTISPECIES: hypothetical protein [Streptomyces]ELP65920.1 hypothetical protein STRTUCAR8_01333 [Streptomyces turgidiscabies Car8]MDX3494541.1 hypothetical protein [Streptomyces turgidiscabies]GAQ76425.1 hypothetical protein T45_08220 [Streptomyces turgidiscabies]